MKSLQKELGLSSLWPMTDPFSRWRVSGTGQRQDTEFIYHKQPDYFDEIVNNGTVTHNADRGDLTLSLSDANDGSYAEMASYPVPYTPGNGQLIEMTGVLNLANITGGSVEVFLRSSISGSPVDLATVPLSEWRYTSRPESLDWSKSHIFGIDFQSLKVGTIRFFTGYKGVVEALAEIHNDNIRDSGYWRTPSLPLFWKVYTAGGETFCEIGYGNSDNAVGFRFRCPANASATLRVGCGTVKSEAGLEIHQLDGLHFATDTGETARTVSTTLLPLVSVRSRDTFHSIDNLILALVNSYSIQTNNPIRVVIINGGALTNASWSDIATAESSLEYDISATAISGGKVELSNYYYATASGPSSSRVGASEKGFLGKSFIWNRKGSHTGILTIAAIRTGGSDASCLASLNGYEIL